MPSGRWFAWTATPNPAATAGHFEITQHQQQGYDGATQDPGSLCREAVRDRHGGRHAGEHRQQHLQMKASAERDEQRRRDDQETMLQPWIPQQPVDRDDRRSRAKNSIVDGDIRALRPAESRRRAVPRPCRLSVWRSRWYGMGDAEQHGASYPEVGGRQPAGPIVDPDVLTDASPASPASPAGSDP